MSPCILYSVYPLTLLLYLSPVELFRELYGGGGDEGRFSERRGWKKGEEGEMRRESWEGGNRDIIIGTVPKVTVTVTHGFSNMSL